MKSDLYDRPATRRRNRCWSVEPLERRVLLATVQWTGSGDGTLWSDPANWSTNAVPAAGDDVIISSAGDPIVRYVETSEPVPLNSLIVDATLLVFGPIVVETAWIDGHLGLQSGTLQGGLWNIQQGVMRADPGFNRLIDAQIVGELELGGAINNPQQSRLRVEGTTTFDHISMTAQTQAILQFEPGYVLQSRVSMHNEFCSIVMIGAGELTVAPGAIIEAVAPFGQPVIGKASGFPANMTLINQGSLLASTASFRITAHQVVNLGLMEGRGFNFSGSYLLNQGQLHYTRAASNTVQQFENSGLLNIDLVSGLVDFNSSWTNTGTIRVIDGSLRLRGLTATADLGTLQRLGGTLRIDAIDNTDASLAINKSTGSWTVTELIGGTVTFAGGEQLLGTRLRDVLIPHAIGGGFILAGETRFEAANLVNATLTLADQYVLRDPVTIEGGKLELLQNATATIAPGTTVRNATGTGTIGAPSVAGMLINEGTIDVAADMLRFLVSYSNRGLMTVAADAELDLQRPGTNRSIIDLPAQSALTVVQPMTHEAGGGIVGEGMLRLVQSTHNFSDELKQFAGAIEVGGLGPVVNFAEPIRPGSLLIATNTTGATVNFHASQEIDFPIVLNAFGRIGGSGDLTILEKLTWNGGIMQDTGRTIVAPGGTIDATTSGGSRSLRRPLDIAGMVILSGTQTALSLFDQGEIEVVAGGKLELLSGAVTGTLGGQSTITNHGTLALGSSKSADVRLERIELVNQSVLNIGAPEAFVHLQTGVFENAGAMNLLGGDMRIQINGATTSAFDVPAGSHLEIIGNYGFSGAVGLTGGGHVSLVTTTRTFPAGQYAGTGRLSINNSTVVFEGPITPAMLRVANTSVVHIEQPSAVSHLQVVSSGTLRGAGDVTVTELMEIQDGTILGDGRITLADGATGSFDSAPGSSFLARSLENFGDITVNRLLRLGSSSTPGSITNHPGAVLSLGAGGRMSFGSQAGTQIENAGTLHKVGVNTTSMLTNVRVINSGLVHLESGSLDLAAGMEQTDTGCVQVDAGSTLTIQASSVHAPGSVIEGDGTLVFLLGDHDVHRIDVSGDVRAQLDTVLRVAHARTGALLVNGDSRVEFLAGPGRVWVTQAIAVATDSRLDLNDNAMIVDYPEGGTSPLGLPTTTGSIFAMIRSGYADGAWTGPGINSSIAAADPQTGLGFGEAASIFSSFPADFLGQSVDNSAVLIRHTVTGDANLDGTVNLADFNRLAENFEQSSVPYSHGDFNYDGTVDLADFNALAGNFGRSVLVSGFLATRATQPEDPLSQLLT